MALTITITLDDAGQISVNGPLDNRMVLYGMLEVAKDSVQKWNDDNERRVQPVTLMPKLSGS